MLMFMAILKGGTTGLVILGGWYSHFPSEVSPAYWLQALYAGENEHRIDNYTGSQNSQSQPGPFSMAPGAWGGDNYIDYTYTETNLPEQPTENIEATYVLRKPHSKLYLQETEKHTMCLQIEKFIR